MAALGELLLLICLLLLSTGLLLLLLLLLENHAPGAPSHVPPDFRSHMLPLSWTGLLLLVMMMCGLVFSACLVGVWG